MKIGRYMSFNNINNNIIFPSNGLLGSQSVRNKLDMPGDVLACNTAPIVSPIHKYEHAFLYEMNGNRCAGNCASTKYK